MHNYTELTMPSLPLCCLVPGLSQSAGTTRQGALREELLQPPHRVRLESCSPGTTRNLWISSGDYLKRVMVMKGSSVDTVAFADLKIWFMYGLSMV